MKHTTVSVNISVVTAAGSVPANGGPLLTSYINGYVIGVVGGSYSGGAIINPHEFQILLGNGGAPVQVIYDMFCITNGAMQPYVDLRAPNGGGILITTALQNVWVQSLYTAVTTINGMIVVWMP